MSKPKPAKPETLTARHKRLRMELECEQMEMKARRLQVVKAKFDAISPGAGSKRRKTEVERKEEDNLHTPTERLQGINLGRNLERNFTNAKGMLRQIKVNVIGHKGKVQFHTENKQWNKDAAFEINSVFAKEADSRGDLHLCDLAQLTIAAQKREGNVLMAFDDFDEDDGKLIFWESDQLATVKADDWKNGAEAHHKNPDEGHEWYDLIDEKVMPYHQANGIIRDLKGREVAYVATGCRGQAVTALTDCMILPRGSAKLLRKPWRFNQGLCHGEMLTASADMGDCYEMRAKELQSAKVAASYAGVVTRKDATSDYDDPTSVTSLPENLGKSTDEIADELAGTTPNYDRLEALTGGYMEYMAEDDDFRILDFNRPNPNLAPFFEFAQASAGASLGLAKCYSKLSADSSYTSFRGDMILTWATFKDDQKWMERQFFDWVAVRRIQWAIDKGRLDAPDTDLWEYLMSWEFPTMPQVDELKEEKAIAQRLKNGRTDWAQLLGPNWEEILRNGLGKQLAVIQELGLPLEFLETKAGAPVDAAPPTDEDDE